MFVQATTTLLENILSDPTQRRAPSDLKLIEPLLILLGSLTKDNKNEEVVAMYQNCGAMFEKTREMVRNAAGNGEQRRLSEKGAGSESLAEFLRRIDSVSAGLDEDGMAIVEPPVMEEEGRVELPDWGAGELSMGWRGAGGFGFLGS